MKRSSLDARLHRPIMICCEVATALRDELASVVASDAQFGECNTPHRLRELADDFERFQEAFAQAMRLLPGHPMASQVAQLHDFVAGPLSSGALKASEARRRGYDTSDLDSLVAVLAAAFDSTTDETAHDVFTCVHPSGGRFTAHSSR